MNNIKIQIAQDNYLNLFAFVVIKNFINIIKFCHKSHTFIDYLY